MNDPQGPVAAAVEKAPAAHPDARPGADTERPRAAGSGARVWRGSAAGRGVEVDALPHRWFPADRDKLIYLAIAAHAGPHVLAQMVQLPVGAWFEDRGELLRTLAPTTDPTS
ncbi:MAG: hypothetical protein M3Y71_16790 [Actinomycetota bacterium]|nr:hypothetical protein [Actinomycetota bacterium]